MAVPFSGDTPESRNTCLPSWDLCPWLSFWIKGTDGSQMSHQGFAPICVTRSGVGPHSGRRGGHHSELLKPSPPLPHVSL